MCLQTTNSLTSHTAVRDSLFCAASAASFNQFKILMIIRQYAHKEILIQSFTGRLYPSDVLFLVTCHNARYCYSFDLTIYIASLGGSLECRLYLILRCSVIAVFLRPVRRNVKDLYGATWPVPKRLRYLNSNLLNGSV